MSVLNKAQSCSHEIIVINGRFLGMQMTGVQRYAYEIVQKLDSIVEQGRFEIAVPSYLKTNLTLKNIKMVPVGKLKNQLWEHISFPLYVKKRKAVPLNLCNVAPLLKPGIATIHDVKIYAHPEFFSKKFILWYKILFWNIKKRSDLIITVSDFSKKEIIKYCGIDENRIVVVPNGWQHYKRFVADMDVLNKYGLREKEYFFSMSSLDPNKNFKWIANIAKSNPLQNFVVAGGMNAKVFSQKMNFEKPENLKFLGYVCDGEAKALMQNSRAFLFPSFYEGFGIPPLEALSTGCPVVVSDIPVMHEVFGDSVHYIDPCDYEIDLETLLNQPMSSVTSVLEKYCWKKSAEKLLNML